MSHFNSKTGPAVNLAGKQFGYYTVISWIFNEKRKMNMWLCKCVCGKEVFNSTYELTSGRHKSCGCMTSKIKSDAKIKDLTGRKFERLLVIEKINKEFRTPQGVPQIKYKCLCDCGNIVEVYAGNLKKGNTKSCGCLNKEATSERELIDLTGMRFEKLFVKERAKDYISPSGNAQTQWLCLCDCGSTIIVLGSSLRRGLTKSCGCIRNSLGEAKIKEYLKTNHIKYKPEYKFDDLLTENGYPMRFDFGVLDENNQLKFLIEYQGPQHYKDFVYNDEMFGKYQREITDPAKKEYCYKNNITLYEIRYDEDIIIQLDLIFKTVKTNMSTPCQAL